MNKIEWKNIDCQYKSLSEFSKDIREYKDIYMISDEDRAVLDKYFKDRIIYVVETKDGLYAPPISNKLASYMNKLYYGEKSNKGIYNPINFNGKSKKKSEKLSTNELKKIQYNIDNNDLLKQINKLKSICLMKKLITS